MQIIIDSSIFSVKYSEGFDEAAVRFRSAEVASAKLVTRNRILSVIVRGQPHQFCDI